VLAPTQAALYIWIDVSHAMYRLTAVNILFIMLLLQIYVDETHAACDIAQNTDFGEIHFARFVY